MCVLRIRNKIFQKDDPDFDFLYINILKLKDDQAEREQDPVTINRITLELDTRLFIREIGEMK